MEQGRASRSYAPLVAAGILLSRVAGLVRDRVFAHYLGNSDAADAFRAAFRIPNILQNLFGEGVLSASFIPVYANLLAQGKREEADRVASAIFCLLALVMSGLVLAGVLATPWLIDAIAPGFAGAKRDLTIRLVRILFPGAALLALSAWCLGILNSHRRFFVSYTAPVIWNAAIIASLIGWGGRLEQFPLTAVAAWGSVAGSALQFGVQLPSVVRAMRGFKLWLGGRSEEVRTVVCNFVPSFVSRGVVQVSAYIDTMIASLLSTGALAGLSYAQTLYMLPISLFGMSVSAAELPVMSSALGADAEVHAQLRGRLDAGLRQIAFFIVPSAAAFLALGDVVAGTIYQTGRFTAADSRFVWAILAGSAVGLLATTMGRLYASAFYSLKDTRTPLKFALVRVTLGMVLGFSAAVFGPPALGLAAHWGAAGLTLAAGVCGWIEFSLLRRALNRRIGPSGLPLRVVATLWGAAAGAALAGWGVKLAFDTGGHPLLRGAAILTAYGLAYLGLTALLRIPELGSLLRRIPYLRRYAERYNDKSPDPGQ